MEVNLSPPNTTNGPTALPQNHSRDRIYQWDAGTHCMAISMPTSGLYYGQANGFQRMIYSVEYVETLKHHIIFKKL